MSYFSSMVSAASKLVSGANLPYELGEERTSFAGKTPWRLYSGRSRKLECDVTVFLYEIKKGTDAQTEMARNAMRRYLTLKHPYCVKCLESGAHSPRPWHTARPSPTEGVYAARAGALLAGSVSRLGVRPAARRHTAPVPACPSGELVDAGIIYLLTEPVTPLSDALAELSRTPASLSWGLYTLAAAVNFLSIDCRMVHGQVSLASVFVDKGMDWKLGGFEMAVEAAKADRAYFGSAAAALPKRYQSPELARGNMEVLSALPVAADWWALGCTIFEIFCGEIKSPADLKKIGDMPEQLKPDYMRLLSANTAQRLRPIELLQNPLFEDAYVSLHLFLEMLNVKDSVEKDRFFTKLAERVPAMPKPAAQWKVLPALTNSLEYGGASAKALEPLLTIAAVLSEEEMQAQVVPTVVKLFANTDRAMRIPLLNTLPQLMPHLTQRTINESIFGHVSLGFADTSPVLRELTVKSVVPLAPKLSRATLGLVMRAFAKLQLDEEAAIRTNTTICLGKIAQYLEPAERERVLIPAFTRALKDPFPPGRNAGILSLTATQQYYKPLDAATRVLPAIAPMVLDPEREVRETALGCLNAYVLKLQQASAAVGRPQGEGQAERDREASDHAVAAAADSVLKSMSWLTSAAQKSFGGPNASGGAAGGAAAGAGAAGVLKPTASGAAGRPPPPPPPNGAPLQPTYSPPALPAGTQSTPPAQDNTHPANDGWGDDDLSNAFSAPMPPKPPAQAPLAARPPAVDPFASLSLGKPPAAAAAPMRASGAGMGGGGMVGGGGMSCGGGMGGGGMMGGGGGMSGAAGMGGGGVMMGGGGMGGGVMGSGAMGGSGVMSGGGMMGGGMGGGGVGGNAGKCASSSSLGSLGSARSVLGTSTGSIGGCQVSPMAPMGSGGNMMNFGAAAAPPKPDFDSLDPLAMLVSSSKPKKVAATRTDGKADDWDSW